tara:strand:- start:1696 stop:2292 length:597 start_codon:yes stop_codon:yes gene_type:complete
MANIFQQLQIGAFRAGITPRTKESQKWFRSKIKSLAIPSNMRLMQQEPLELRNRQGIGNMYMYVYDAKHKETLPYFDRFPLTIVVGPAKGGFMGINLHYLPPMLRAKFLDGLMDVTNNKKFDESTRFSVTIRMMEGASKLKYFKPCLKHYLTRQIRTRLALVPAPEWEIAAFLPTANFSTPTGRQGVERVYSDSRGML